MSALIAFVQVVSAVGAATVATIKPPALEPLVGAPEKASAHNLQMEIGMIALDPSSRPLFDTRLAANQPLIQANDVITIVFGGLSFIGTNDGLGGYFDFYPVTGTTVLNAEYVVPVPGGYARTPIKKGPGPGVVIAANDPTGTLKNFTLGPNLNGVTAKPANAGNVLQGTLDGFYGDTGIFYSTDPRTAQGSFPSTGNIVNNRGEDVDNDDFTGQPVPVTRFDIEQLRAQGMSSPANCMLNSTCRGTPPWGLSSPVAGPESGYQWSFRITNTLQVSPVPSYTIETGPFRRIQYPGSRISNDTPGNTSGAIFDTSKDASSIGYALSPATPLPSTTSWTDTTSTKLVRFALGRIVNGQPEYARVAIRIDNINGGILNAQGCPVISAYAFSGDAGINSGPKDHLWRYFNPTIKSWNPCLVLFKEPSKTALATNEVFTYSLRAFNTGPVTLTNVIIRDTLPAGLQYISAVPTTTTSPNPQQWNIGLLPPNRGWSAVLTVRALTPGIQVNNLTLTSNQGGAGTQAIVGVAVPIMNETKSVAPASVAPGGTVTYTIRLRNTGTGNSSVPIRVFEFLPTGFSFGSLRNVTVNGANVTSGSTAVAAGTNVTISLPAASFIVPNNEAVIVFTAQVAQSTTAGTYCNNFNVAYGSATDQVANVACVSVGGGAIGDTVYRDWNGNGVQDPGEEGIPGAVVQLTPPTGPVITTTTNASGTYLFNGLVAGNYTVTVISGAAGFTATQGSGGYLNFSLATNEQKMDRDFGFTPAGTGSIGNTVYNDIANNGAEDVGDTGIPSVTVWLYEDTNGNGRIDAGQDNLIMTTTTNVSGTYGFTNLATGLNYIALVNASDPDIATALGGPSANSTPTAVAVPNLSGAFVDADFGFWRVQPGSIGDTVCVDANLDGLCTAGESGVPNVPVFLFLNGVLIDSTTSSITGTYSFNNLGPGNYTVAIDRDDPSIPQQLVPTVTNIPVTLGAGQIVTTADFPLQPLITKQVNRLTANLSDTLIYTITPNYNGNDVLDNLTIKDPLPAGTQFITASAGGVFGPFVPQGRVDGFDEGDLTFSTGMTVTVVPSATRVGGTVTVTMRLTSTTSITNVVPSLTPVNGDATCSAPSPTGPVTVANASPQLFTFTCTVLDYGEYTFLGNASGLRAGADYDFPTGQSNSVLASRTGSTSLVTWTLGSTREPVDGVTLSPGSVPVIYATRGGNTEFDLYYVLTNTWQAAPPTNPTGNVKLGGALVWNGTTGAGASVFGLRGDGQDDFRRYDVLPTNAWTALASTPNDIKWGGALTRIGGVIYAFRGDDRQDFYTYTISSNTWATAASFGFTVKEGGSLTTDGTFVYGLRGDGGNQFRRYNPATNTWTALANTPTNIKQGGALVFLNGFIYALRGDNRNSFFRYNISTNTWAAMANTPANVKDGGALTTDGRYIYALRGDGTRNFWRYDPTTNAWTTRASTLGNIAAGGALAFVQGTADVSLNNSMDVNDTFISSGQQVTLTMDLFAASNITNVTPGPLTISDTALAGGTSTCAGPLPASANVISGTTTTFAWTCTLTATTRPANIFFSAAATGTLPSTIVWGRASSPSVIVVPLITMTLRVLSSTMVSTVDNVALFGDESGTVGPVPSNLVQTTIGSGIGDFVWVDLDRDGVQDPGEPGLAGVVMTLTRPIGPPITTTTDVNGNYYFGNLGSGTFTVTYNLATAPAGYAPTTPIQLTYNITFAQVITTADFGVKPPGLGAIGDTVWLDENNDGILNNTEQGLPGITVRLYADVNGNSAIDAGDALLQSTATDATGYYTFTNLYAGPYLVQVDTSSTVTSSIFGISNGITATLGAAMTPTIGTTITRAVSLTTNSTFTDIIDFGFNWSGYIGDYGWYDTNGDGIQNNPGDEGPARDMVVELVYDVNGNGEPDIGEPLLVFLGPFNTGTGPDGLYIFPHLPPGKYIVEGEGQAIPAPQSSGVLSGTVGVMMNTTPYEIPFTLGPGQAITTFDFGFAAGAIVEGHVWYDENSSGTRDPNEPVGFPSVVVTLTGVISTPTGFQNVVLTTTTDSSSGEYEFPPVLPGAYTVTYNTAAPVLANFPLQTTPAVQTFDLSYGQEKIVDFGRDYSGAIGDLVWLDSNGDFTQTVGEPGIPDATVLLYQGGALVGATTSGVTGSYLFTGLAAGVYTVTVLTSTIPPSYTLITTPPSNVWTVNLITNTRVLTADFGYRSPTPVFTVTGRVVSDTTGTIGVVDPGDPGLKPNVQVQVVYTPTGGAPITLTSPIDANGNYTVTGILQGSNVAISVVPASVPLGYTHSTTPTLTINNITANTPNQNFGFVFAPASLAGTVVVGNGNGIAEVPPETVVSGVTVTLLYAGPDGAFGTGDEQTFTTTTNASGRYTFTNLFPGAYFVNQIVPAGYNALADRDGGTPTEIFASLAISQNLTGQDFELEIIPADLQVTKRDSADPIVAGNRLTYTLVVTNAGPGVANNVIVSDSLPAGASYVSASPAPSSTNPITWALGTLAVNATRTLTVVVDVDRVFSGTLTNTASITSSTPDITPTNNTATEPTGVTPGVGSITGTVFLDANGNGQLDPAEAGLPNITVLITDSNNLTYTVTTDANGLYTQTNVTIGTATVDVVNPPAGFVQTAGTDPSTVNVPPAGTGNAGIDGYQPQADLRINKTNNLTQVVPGTLVTYTIVVTNSGPISVTGARITDTVPVTLSNAGWTCVAGAGAVCSTPLSGSGSLSNYSVTLAVNSVLTFTLTGTVWQTATGNIANTAVVTPPLGITDPITNNNTSTDDDPLVPQADLQVAKSNGVNGVTPGTSTTYRITVTNNGPSAVTGATVTDTLPAQLTGASWTCATCTPASGSGDISVTVDLLSGQSAVIVLTGTVPATATGTLTNTAVVAPPPGVTDTVPTNNTDTDIDPLNPQADLQIDKGNGLTSVVPGDLMTYTIVVTNAGPSAVVGARITDTLPVTLSNASWACTAGANASCGTTTSGLGNIANISVTMAPNTNLTFTVTGTVISTATGFITNTAVVAAPPGVTDPTPGNNTSSDNDPLTPFVNLGIFKTNNQLTAVPGTRITYTIAVSNSGPSAATGVAISDAIPSALLSPTWSCAGTTCNSPTSGNGNISTTVTLLPGARVTFTVVATLSLSATGKLTNTARLTPPPGVTNTNPVSESTDVDDITPAVVTGTIFVDTNGNGQLNPGEPPLTGASVIITDSQGVTRSVTVDANGNYTVTLPPGSFTATVNPATVPPGYVLTSNNDTQTGTATPGITGTDPVGYQPRGDVTGTVFLDTNGNGTPDPGEGLPNVQVVITDAFGTPVIVTTTASGQYTLTNVPSGTAVVDVVNSTLPNGVTQTVGTDPSTVVVNPGVVNNAGLDGYRQIGDVTGTVFLDTNGNGIKDAGEGLPLVSVIITDSAGLTKTFQTDANGLYTFTAVTSGTAVVNVIDSTLPNGVTQTVGTDPTNVTVQPNQVNFEENNGYRQIGTVSGFVYNDVDGNGSFNPLTDVVSGGVTVVITDSAGLTKTTTTLASGFFTFTAVTSGTARVDLINPPAGTQTQGTDPTNVTVQPNQNNFEENNGFYNPGTVTGTVFEDTNGNGTQDANEPGIPNVTVLITDSQGVTRTVLTNPSGVYTATNVPSGTATVDVVNSTLPAGYIDTTLVDPSTVDVQQGVVNDAGKDGYQPRADLRISKTDNQTIAVPGTRITYTIVVTNAGPAPVVGARVTDTLPAELQNPGWVCSAGAGATCPTPSTGSTMNNLSVTLGVNSVLTFTLTGTVNANATGEIVNTVAVTTPAGITDPQPNNNTDTDTDTLTPRADLQIDKSNGVGSVVPGDRMTYTIVVTNAGPSAVVGARITDTLPVTLSNASWACTAGAGTVCGTTSGIDNIENISVTMQPNSVLTFTVTGTVISTATGFITNTAVVAPPPGVTDPTPGNNTSSDNDPLTPLADLQIDKDDGVTAVVPGTSTTYRITVTNNGLSAVTGATVSDTLPAALTNATWTCATCAQTSGSGNISTSVTLLPGQSAVIVLTATVAANATGNIVNTAVVTTPAGVTDTVPTNNTDSDTNTLNPQADLRINKTNNLNAVVPGTLVTYTIVVTNTGPSAVTGARITDTLPAELQNPGWVCSAGAGATCPTPSTGSTMNNLSVTMGVNSVLTFTLTGTVAQSSTGIITNTAVVALPPGVTDPTPGNNESTDADPTDPRADLQIDKDDGVAVATPGLALTYRITVTNNGPSAVTGALVSDTLPAALTNATWTCATCTPNTGSGSLINTNVSLLSGQIAVIIVTGTVAADATGSITNTAVVTVPAGVTDPTPGNNTDTDIDTLTPSVDLAVRKSVQPANAVVPGTALTYTVVVSNAGPSKAVGATVNDTFPVALTGASWACVAGAGAICGTSSGTGSINGVSLTLNVNSAVTFIVNGIVAGSATGNIVNTAVVTTPAGATDPTPLNNTSTVTNPLTPEAFLGIFKTNNQLTAVPGTRITYTVAVTNGGPSDANGVVISDAIPSALLSPAWSCAGASGGVCNSPTSGNGNISTTVNVPAGGQVTFTVVATLSLSATGKLTNTARLTPPPGVTNTNPLSESTDVDDITPAVVTGTIFVDTNGNGQLNPGEPPLTGVSVIITDSQGVTRSVTVDANGNYTATLPPGPFTTTVNPATVPPGYVLTSNNDTQTGTATPGTTSPTIPVGYQPQGTVTGFVYIDYNGNGTFSSTTDVPLQGVTVTVLSQGKLITVVTDVSGFFTATGVPSGTATVDLINPPPYLQTQGTDPTSNVTVLPNQVNFEENNGFFVTGSITGTVFQDTNGDSFQDPGEPGLPNVTVLITDSLGVTRTVQTDPNGVYTATLVPSGTATVDVVNSTLPSGLRQTAGTDPSTVNVVPDTTQNAGLDGYQPTATVGNRVWEDYNFNGIQDTGEQGIAGVTVTLQTPTGTIQTTTDANGLYTFTSLIPNAVHTMTFIAPAGGYTFTAQDLGGNDATDSDPNPTTGVVTFTLAPAQVNQDVDAGLWRPMTLGNSVWYDANGNGVQDSGEAGVQNVSVQLYRDVNGNNALDAGDSFVTAASTDAGGLYTFTNQISSTYIVVITSTNFAAGGALFNYQSSDGAAAGNSDQNGVDHGNVAGTLGASGFVTSAVTLIPGTEPVNDGDTNNNTNLTLDFGFYSLSLAGNLVWQDFNNNGLYEPGLGETPIPSVTVLLLNNNGVQLLTTQTDAGGLYTFTNLVSGTYQVQVVMPTGYVNSTYVPTQTLGIDNDDNGVTTTLGSTLSSQFTLVPGASQPINNPLTASSANNTLDFGLWQPMTLGGQAWNDKNNNGLLENGEALFSGVAVELYRADGSGLPTGALVSTTTTVAGGLYTFTNILSGTYVVVITDTNFLPGGVLAGFYNSDGAPVTDNNVDGDDDGRPFGAATASGPITLVPGTEPGGNVNTTVDFGFYTLSLGGAAWNDANNNGVQDAGETGLSAYAVNLYRVDSNGAPIGGPVSTTTTSASGQYTFTGLVSDTYMVEIVPQGNYRSSTGVNGSPSGPYEPAPAVNSNNAITDDNGTQAGNVIRTSSIRLNAGAQPTNDDGDANTNFTVGFALFQPISIGNQVWNDANNDGLNSGEAGLDGVTMNVYSGTTLVSTTVTSGGGFYTFTWLIPGNYVIEAIPPAGFVSSSGSNGNVTGPYEPAPDPDNSIDNDDNGTTVSNTIRSSVATVAVGGGIGGTNAYPTVDFGLLLPATIGDRVWNDANSNGIQENGETGLVGAQVVLYDALTNAPIATTTTGVNGLYTFTKVIPGSYYLVFPLPVGYGRSPQQNQSTPDASGKTNTFSVTAGQVKDDMDAGYFQFSSIGDRVWNDLSANGIQDAGEPGVAGITVTLFSNGAPVSTTLTDNTGFYAFVNITPGVPLSVQVAVPAGYLVSPQNAGGDETTDNDADAQGSTNSVVIVQDTFYQDLDIGMWAPLTLGGQVWNDLNNNGAEQSGEPPKDGVLVRLYRDSNSNNVFDAGDEFVQQTTTSNGGLYTFTNVTQGNYLVVLDASNFAPGGVLAGYKSSDFNDTTDANNDGLDDGRPAFGGSISSGVIRMEAGTEPSGLLKQENYTVDFGVWLPASLGGVVWLDVNHDGQQDAGEPARNGVPVTLRDGQGNVVSTTTTGVINGVPGSYSFGNLIPGSYYVTFPLPGDCVPSNASLALSQGCVWTYPNQGSDATDSDVDANGQTGNYTLVPGQNENTVGAGYWRPPTLVPGKSTKVTGPVKSGDLITYTLDVRNAGDTMATGVVITDPLPSGVSFVSASDGGQVTPGGIVWRLPNIPPGQTVSVQVVVKVGNPTGNTLIVNVFTLSSDGVPGTTLVVPSNEVSTPFAPTAVTLSAFNATVETRGVRVTWQTALERNTFGFFVLRSVTGNRDDATPVNAEPIVAVGPSTYSVVDEAGSAGNTYWLQEIELDGDRIDYGPVVARATLPGVTQPQPNPNAGGVSAPQPAPNAGVPGVGIAGGGVAVQPQAQPAAPVAQPQPQQAGQQPAVLPAVPAVILPEPTAQPQAQSPAAQLPQAQPVVEPTAQPVAQPQPQQPVAQPAPADVLPAPTVESVVVGAQTGVNVSRGGQPAAAQLPAANAQTTETVQATPQPLNPLLPAGAGLLALLGLSAAGALALRKRNRRK